MKRALKIFLILIALLVLVAGGFVAYLSLTEYRPQAVEPLTITPAARRDEIQLGDMLTLVTFNTGYAGLDRDQDFVMDGGKGVNPKSESVVRENMSAVLSALDSLGAQICLLQEVDEASARSFRINQMDYYRRGMAMNAAMAYNYKCDFVPFPWPPIGKVQSGVVTLTELNITAAERQSLPVPFSWPVRAANLKRCLLVERMPVTGTEHELVLINLHLEAYDDGEGKLAQTRQLVTLLEAEYAKGNYVIAGGDFNQTFPGVHLPVVEPDGWQPGQLEALPEGLSYVYDASTPTCRSLSKPYSGNRETTQFYVIDGFIVSDNLKVNHIETVDLNFLHSDHNPVLLQVTLK